MGPIVQTSISGNRIALLWRVAATGNRCRRPRGSHCIAWGRTPRSSIVPDLAENS